MGYPIRSDTVYIDIYEQICNTIKEDASIAALSDGVVFDFDLVDTPITPPAPRDVPRIYLLPTSVSCPVESSCNNDLTLEYSVVIDGFHFRDARLAKIAWRMMFLLRYFPVTSLVIDGASFFVQFDVGTGSWDYGAERQTMTHQIGFTVRIKV